jgi:cob(I)alamin adenosyltransferase
LPCLLRSVIFSFMKIYTGGGDKGKSGLIGGKRVEKDDLRLEAYGSVDELVASIGVARGLDLNAEFSRALAAIQSTLLVVGSRLAAPAGATTGLPELGAAPARELEGWIDAMEGELPPLKNFILPGGEPLGASLHLSRTVCRRAERRVVTLAHNEELEPDIIIYLNRLSDFLFVAARLANRRRGADEEAWIP